MLHGSVDRWPGTCSSCGSDFVQGVGVIEVVGVLHVTGYVEYGEGFGSEVLVSHLSSAPHPRSVRSDVVRQLSALKDHVHWSRCTARCSECGEWIEELES